MMSIPLLLLGAWVAMERTALAQSGLALPVFAAALASLFTGSDPGACARLAIVLGMLSQVSIPVGEKRLRDFGLATLIGAWWLGPNPDLAREGAVVVLSLPVALLGGWTVGFCRDLNLWLAPAQGPLSSSWSARRSHLLGLAIQALRGILLVGLLSWPGLLVLGWVDGLELRSLEWLPSLLPWICLPALIRFHWTATPGSRRLRFTLLTAGLVGAGLLHLWISPLPLEGMP